MLVGTTTPEIDVLAACTVVPYLFLPMTGPVFTDSTRAVMQPYLGLRHSRWF